MKFRNLTDDALWVPSLGVEVPPGDDTPELTDDQAAGFAGQTDVWEAINLQPAPKATKTPEEK